MESAQVSTQKGNQPAAIYDSNPFTTAAAGIKKLFDHNLGLLVGISAFMVALLLGMSFVFVALAVSLLGLTFSPTGLAGTPANLLGPADFTGSRVVTLVVELALLAAFGVLLIQLTYQAALTSSKNSASGFGAVLKQAWVRLLPGLGMAAILLGGCLAPFIVIRPFTSLLGYASLIVLPILVIALLYCGFRLSFAWFALLEGHGPIDSLKRSWLLTSGHMSEVLGSIAVGALVALVPMTVLQALNLIAEPAGAILGLLSFLLLPAIAIISVVSLSERFIQLNRAADSQQPATKPHPANYLAIGIYLVVAILYASLSSNTKTLPAPAPQPGPINRAVQT